MATAALSSALNVNPVDKAVRAATTAPPAASPQPKQDLGAKLEQERNSARENVAKLVGEEAQYKNDQEMFKVQQQGQDAAKKAELIRQERETITGSDPYKQLQETELSIAREQFHPTERSIGENLALAAATTIMGHMIGRGGKVPATITLAGMNGMMEGIRAGDLNRYKEQKQKFEDGLNNLVRKSQTLSKQLERITKLAATDKEEAYYEAQALFAKEGADFMAQHARQRGLAATLELAKLAAKKAEETLAKYETERQKRQDKIDQENVRFQHQQELRALQFGYQQQLAEDKKQGKSEKATQQQYISQRAVTALRGAASVVESIMRLPSGANAGILPYLSTKDGMINYVKNNLGRKVTPSESKAVETLYSGVSRYLATIEASGTATGLTVLAGQLDKLKPQPNDATEDIALKLADIRRISTEAIQGMIDSGLMPEQQARAAQEQIHRMEKAIPYTTNDVVDVIAGRSETIGESTTKAIPTKVDVYGDPDKEARYQKWLKENPQ